MIYIPRLLSLSNRPKDRERCWVAYPLILSSQLVAHSLVPASWPIRDTKGAFSKGPIVVELDQIS